MYSEVNRLCAVTIAVRDRRAVFANAQVATAVIDVLRDHAARMRVTIYGDCVMPDHVHLVMSPSASCDVITFVGQFKNLAQRAAWRLGVEGAFWQKSFWDRFLRADDEVRDAVQYALDNPVRGGLVQHWRGYPFSGSFVFEL
jgi:REP element-mobilizing transposase RayT